jgi:Sulfotransferase family
MGRLVFVILKIYKNLRLIWLGISGRTEADIHAKRIVTGRAWSEFCEHLKTAGAVLAYLGAPRDAFQQTEGVRYLSRLTRAALEAYVEYGDEEFPELRRMVHETVKIGADNPDQRPAKRWVLKSPHHMEFLDLAKKHFGQVHSIWTHRNILESLPSFISMVAHSQTIFSDQVSLDRVAGHRVRKTGSRLIIIGPGHGGQKH